MNKLEGVVKFYNQQKKFGFITGDDGTAYFFHESGIEPGNTVKDEDKVTFEIVEGDKGPKAEHVKLSTGGATEEPAAEAEEAPAEEATEETKEEAPAEEATEETKEEAPAEE